MKQRYDGRAAVPAQMPYGALICAANACENSEHESDRIFAAECITELQRRLDELPPLPPKLLKERRLLAELESPVV